MLKKIFVFFIVMFILTGCSKEEKVWKKEYLNVVNNWENEKDEDALGYTFIFLDKDEIPELVLYCNDGAYIGFDMYTIYEGKAKKLELVEYPHPNERIWESAILTSHGRQMQQDDCYLGTGIYIQSYGMNEDYWMEGYLLQDGLLKQVFRYYEHPNKFIEDKYNYEVTYRDKYFGRKEFEGGLEWDGEPSGFHLQMEELYEISFEEQKNLLDESHFLNYREVMKYLTK